jgi:hypothetical protein
MKFRYPKGVCPIPLADRIRGSRLQTNKFRPPTRAERVVIAARKERSAVGGRLAMHNRHHGPWGIYNPDCCVCSEAI